MKKNLTEQNHSNYRVTVTFWSQALEESCTYHLESFFDTLEDAADAIRADVNAWLQRFNEPDNCALGVSRISSNYPILVAEYDVEGYDALIRSHYENDCHNTFGYKIYPVETLNEKEWIYRSDFRIVHHPSIALYGVYLIDKCIGIGHTLPECLTFIDRLLD